MEPLSRGAHHGQTNPRRGDVLTAGRLLPRVVGHHQNHHVEPQIEHRGLRGLKVAQMGRVERPAEKSDPARSRRELGTVHDPMLPVGQRRNGRTATVTTAPHIPPDLRICRISGCRDSLCNLRMTKVTMTGLYSARPMWLTLRQTRTPETSTNRPGRPSPLRNHPRLGARHATVRGQDKRVRSI